MGSPDDMASHLGSVRPIAANGSITVPAIIEASNCGPGGTRAIVATRRSRMNGSAIESDW